MAIKNTIYSYGSVAKSFHWIVAVTIIGMLALGFIMTGMKPTPDMFKLYNIHKSTGSLLLILVCLRLMWKIANKSPILPPSLPKFERFLAHLGHFVLYALMFAMPFTGLLMSSAAGFTVSVFGWFTMPNLIAPMPEWKGLFRNAHEIIAWSLIVMVCLHALAALLHHFYYRNNVLRRMLPFVKEVTSYEPQTIKDSDTHTGC